MKLDRRDSPDGPPKRQTNEPASHNHRTAQVLYTIHEDRHECIASFIQSPYNYLSRDLPCSPPPTLPPPPPYHSDDRSHSREETFLVRLETTKPPAVELQGSYRLGGMKPELVLLTLRYIG